MPVCRSTTPSGVFKSQGLTSQTSTVVASRGSACARRSTAATVFALAIDFAVASFVVEPPPADAPLDQQLDLAAVYAERVKLTRGSYVAGSGEPKLRALEHAVNVYRQNHPNVGLNDAKQMVLDAIKRSSTKETTTP